MRRRNNILEESDIRRGGLLMLAPLFISGQQTASPATPRRRIRAMRSFPPKRGWFRCNVTVTDKSGHLVTNLPQSAFQVFENGVLQPIKLFKREDVPVSLGLIIDNSGSMREKRQGVESAALALVKRFEPAGRGLRREFQRRSLPRCRFHQRHRE